LALFAVPAAVEADFGEDERPISGQVVKSSEIGIQRVLMFEVDIEAKKIEEREVEIFRRRKVDIGDERVRIGLFSRAIEPLQKALNRFRAMPADDRRRDLVPDAITQNGGVLSAAIDGGLDLVLDPSSP